MGINPWDTSVFTGHGSEQSSREDPAETGDVEHENVELER